MAVLALVGHDPQTVLMGDSTWLPFAEALRTRRVNLRFSHRTLKTVCSKRFHGDQLGETRTYGCADLC